MTFKLKEWYLQEHYWGGPHTVCWGFVYDNPRFSDGVYVHTSLIKEIDMINKRVKTLNSVYELEGEPSQKMLDVMEASGKELMDYHTNLLDEDGNVLG